MDTPPPIPPPSPEYDDVAAWGLSLRGIITFLLIATVCVLAVLKIENQTINAMALVCLGFYFRK